MTKLAKLAVTAALDELADLLELKDDKNVYRARAYRRAARSLAALADVQFETLVTKRRLTDIPGIGESIASVVEGLANDGTTPLLEELRAETPSWSVELAQIPSLTREKIERLHADLGIRSIADLESAARAGKVRDVRGFGVQSEAKLLQAIELLDRRDTHILLSDALRAGEQIVEYLESHRATVRAELAGGIRRWCETVPEIRVVAEARSKPEAVVEHFRAYPPIASVETTDTPGRVRVRLADGMSVVLDAVSKREHALALFATTGSPEHIARIEAIAAEKDLVLSDRRLSRRSSPRSAIAVASEESLYERVGLSYVPPEIRDGTDEIDAAREGKIPADLVTVEDVRGLVHCHTTYSDGVNSILEMARAADDMGMAYMTITDHSPTASYAGGVPVDRLRRQWDEIDEAQQNVRVRLLKGTESDILADGSLDYPDAILERLDVIIASVHNRYRMDEAEMTRRLVRAMRLPVFKIWGHALGRLIEQRPPFAARVEDVLDAIADSRAAIEINGDPKRLDMEPRWVREARKRRISFVLSTDAHSMRALANVRFAVGVARRAGVRKREVLNTKGVAAFARAVRPVASDH